MHWTNEGKTVTLQAPFGILVKSIADRRYAVAIVELDADNTRSELVVFNADGTRRLTVANTQCIRGRDRQGQFAWFEAARVDAPDCFGVVFQPANDSAAYLLDISAIDGAVLGVHETR